MIFTRTAQILGILCATVSAVLTLVCSPSREQTGKYAVGESAPTAAPAIAAGPVRLAWFSYKQGDIFWRPNESTDWYAAQINLPLKVGAQVWAAAGGRAEIQYDDGSYLRLGSGAIATLDVMFSDTEGEFTEVGLKNGLAMLQVKHNRSLYQIDTPMASAKSDGPSRMRIGVGAGVEIAVIDGAAAVENSHGKTALKARDFLYLGTVESPLKIQAAPSALDSWETWNLDRTRIVDGSTASLISHNVPPNIRLVAGNLDDYGSWLTDPINGEVWHPNTKDPDWRPYYAGHWIWLNPFGWTWCSDEPWGWAPYHYGTWVHGGYGWAWSPGPVNQYWSPGVVSFSESDRNVAWCALSPSEVHYPDRVTDASKDGDSFNSYSIGLAGCYYPESETVCLGRSFDTSYVNRTTYTKTILVNGSPKRGELMYVVNSNQTAPGPQFIPLNARNAAGGVVASPSSFVGSGTYDRLTSGSVNVFADGHSVRAPVAGGAPISGPSLIRPSALSLTPTRSITLSRAPSGEVISRHLYRIDLSARVAAGAMRPIDSDSKRPFHNRDNAATRPVPRSTGASHAIHPGTSANPISKPPKTGAGKSPIGSDSKKEKYNDSPIGSDSKREKNSKSPGGTTSETDKDHKDTANKGE